MPRLAPFVLIPLLSLVACVSEPARGASGIHTETTSGVVVNGELEATWATTKASLAGLSPGPLELDESRRVVEAAYRGGTVRIQVEAYDARKSILRVHAERDGAEDRALADSVLLELLEHLRR